MRLSDGRDPIVADCPECTKPESSGRISVDIANALHDGRYKVRNPQQKIQIKPD